MDISLLRIREALWQARLSLALHPVKGLKFGFVRVWISGLSWVQAYPA